VAPNFIVFLLGRAVQAIGTGGISPITAAQIAMSYPPDKRGKAMGLIGVFFGIGTILGPVLGGVIIAFMPWQWIFLINVPISLIILAMISRFRSEQQSVRKQIDAAGIVLLTLLLLSLMLGITQVNAYAFSPGQERSLYCWLRCSQASLWQRRRTCSRCMEKCCSA
jgi:MFS family permease